MNGDVREPDKPNQLFHGATDENGKLVVLIGDYNGPLVCVSEAFEDEESMMECVRTMNTLAEKNIEKRVTRALPQAALYN